MIIIYFFITIIISINCYNCTNYFIVNSNKDIIENVSSIINSIGFIPHNNVESKYDCSYNIIKIKNNIDNIISHNYENIIYSINKYNFINSCYNNSFCYNINITDINEYPFLAITNFIFYKKSYDIIQGCENMKSLYLYIIWLLTDNYPLYILKNYTATRMPFYIINDIMYKLNNLTCEYYNGSVYYIKDIYNYSKIIYGSGSSFISDIEKILQQKFYDLYGINIIYDSINSYDGINNLKENKYLFSLSEIIDYNDNFFIIPSFISPIIFIYNYNNKNDLIVNINEIKNFFLNNDNDFIKIIRNNKSGIYNILFNKETINTYQNEIKCNINYCNKNIIIIYYYLFIFIIIFILIFFIFFIKNDKYYIKLSKIKYDKEDIHNSIFDGIYNKKKIIIKCLEHDFINYKYKNNIKKICKLNHPNIINIFGYTHNNMILMEYMHLGSLNDVLYNSTIKIDNYFIFDTIQQIIEGILYLHNLNTPIIHNNLKMTNILVNNKLNIKISDFNILNKKIYNYNKNIFYIAPEVLENNIITKASDIYSFGIILYELINLKEPYYDIDENIETIVSFILDKKNPLRPININKIKNIDILLNNCLNYDYKLRPSINNIKKLIENFKNEIIGIIKCNKKSIPNILINNNIPNFLLYNKKFLSMNFKNVSILFLDIYNYTSLLNYGDDIVFDLLNRFYNCLDDLVIPLKLIKIGNIRDSYIICNNLEENSSNNIKNVCLFALEAIKIASKTYIDLNNPDLGTINIKIGINFGDVIGHIIEKNIKNFNLFGDTINLASQMKNYSLPMKIQCSKNFALMLKSIDNNFIIENRGFINIKGKGYINTYFINSYSYDKNIKFINSIFSETLKNIIQE